MKYVILGGVAAGTKAAAKLKRLDRLAEVLIFTKSADISYAGCGLPYYIGGDIASREELIVNSPEKYAGLTGAKVQIGCEAIGVECERKEVTIRRTDGSVFAETYDKLIIATGAAPLSHRWTVWVLRGHSVCVRRTTRWRSASMPRLTSATGQSCAALALSGSRWRKTWRH